MSSTTELLWQAIDETSTSQTYFLDLKKNHLIFRPFNSAEKNILIGV